ncbi:hypothetical protein RHMOL_Rhmol06G0090400 [Rhododendron molle]|uniref:Uncharacterized protein n=1 Tax=Rhododendron molle TaxID=49168 RepID=A0ACC0NAP4_RHOML|nr:hypothetical protein RHMOL_Rhmol06G0090400 [Rhododendron molle]
MKRKRHSANGSYADKEDGGGAACNQTSKEVVLGDLIWVSLHGSSWWPAQVFDDNADLARLRSGGGNAKKGSTSQEPIERRMKVMQRLGLTALSGSLFRQNGHIDPDLSLCS